MSIANQKDIETIIKLRKEQLLDQGMPATENIDDNMRAYFENVFEQNNIYQVFLIENEQIVSTGAVVFQQIPPAYDNYTGVEGYITNVYTIKSYRGLGLGKHMRDQVPTKWREDNISVVNLESSSQAAPLYSRSSFIKYASAMTIELGKSEVNRL